MAEWRINLARTAEKQIAELDEVTRKRVRSCIDVLPDGDVKKLKGYAGLYRARVGDWRVIFEIDFQHRAVNISAVLPRDKAYK